MQRVTVFMQTTAYTARPPQEFEGSGLEIAVDGEFVIVKNSSEGVLAIFHAPREAVIQDFEGIEDGDE